MANTNKLSKEKKERIIECLLSKFLLVTFTDAAAQQMRERLAGAFLEEGYEIDPTRIPSLTFNAMDMNLIAEFYKDLGYKKIPSVVDVNPTAEAGKVLPLITGKNEIPGINYRIPVEMNMGRSGAQGALILALRVFEIIRSEGLDYNDPNALDTLIDIIQCDNQLYSKLNDQAIADIFAKYNKYAKILKTEGFITFADQEPLGIKVLDLHPDYLASLGIEHVVVDEFQDSNDMNMEFVRRLAGCMEDEGGTIKSIMVIGDDSQSIYGFRNADVTNMTDFAKKIQPRASYEGEDGIVHYKMDEIDESKPERKVEALYMTENYRSYSEIVDPANKLIELNTERVDKPLRAAKGKGGEFNFRAFWTPDAEMDYITEEISRLVCEEGVDPKDIAIIARTKKPLLKMQDKLVKAEIPATLTCPVKVMDDSRVKAAIAITDAFYDPQASQSYKIYLNALCMEKYGKSVKTIYDDTEDYDLAVDALRRKFVNQETANPAILLHDYHELLEDINCGEIYDKWLQMIYDAEYKGVKDAIRQGVLSEDSEDEDSEDVASVKLSAALEFVSDFKRFGASTEMKMDKTYEGVAITTAHSSKGLEWPIVFNMISEYDNRFLHSRVCPANEIEEVRRLLFVSMTRAMQRLYVTSQYTCFYTDKKNGSDGIQVENQFLKELYDLVEPDWDWVPVDPMEEIRKAEKKRAAAEKARQRRREKALEQKAAKAMKNLSFAGQMSFTK